MATRQRADSSAPGVMIYLEFAESIEQLSQKEQALLLRTILEYGRFGTEPEQTPKTKLIWGLMRTRIERDMCKYVETSNQRRYAVYVRETRRAMAEPLTYEQWLASQQEEEKGKTAGADRELLEIWQQRRQDLLQAAVRR